MNKWEVTIMPCRKVTIEKVEEKRQEMIKLGAIYGLTSLLTVQASQELDTLLNALASKRDSDFSLQKAYRYF
ncbi:hypothetical protein B8W99_01740 [Peribacillus simplex]|nr:hypothetical protein CHI08_04005 [Peribacillus simplex]PAL18355.1 hypothetical protein B8W99_01740 [Peribacillus simplex]